MECPDAASGPVDVWVVLLEPVMAKDCSDSRVEGCEEEPEFLFGAVWETADEGNGLGDEAS